MTTRRNFITTGAAVGAGLLMSKMSFGAGTDDSTNALKAVLGKGPILTSHTFSTPRHTTHYWEAGPADGPLMIFLHGWPQIGLMWRAQIEAFAAEGWHCVAPDMRGYGSSSAPKDIAAYTTQEIVQDMAELHDHLGGKAALWVGHDWGSPISGTIAAQHPKRSRGVVLISVPYFPNGFALPNVVAQVDRTMYPAEKYPNGQWDYWGFYLTNFDQAASDMEADVSATLAGLYRHGNPASVGKISASAFVTSNGGRYGAAHRAPATTPDYTIWPAADFDALVTAFKTTGFRPGNAWYLHDDVNIAYAKTAANGGALSQPVLFVNGEYDTISNINLSAAGDPMRQSVPNLSVVDLPSGHWLPLEQKPQLTDAIRSWCKAKGLK